jgi:hypothetical protein
LRLNQDIFVPQLYQANVRTANECGRERRCHNFHDKRTLAAFSPERRENPDEEHTSRPFRPRHAVLYRSHHADHSRAKRRAGREFDEQLTCRVRLCSGVYDIGVYKINAFAAAADGSLTPIPGEPFAGPVTSMAVNGKFLFGADTDAIHIDSYLMGKNGTLY